MIIITDAQHCGAVVVVGVQIKICKRTVNMSGTRFNKSVHILGPLECETKTPLIVRTPKANSATLNDIIQTTSQQKSSMGSNSVNPF